jgi:tetratricopeptide (TPR) repeat protein
MTGNHFEQNVPEAISIARANRSSRKASGGYSREVVLLSCFGLMSVLLTLTALISRMYHKEVHVLADQWFQQGGAQFNAGDAVDAVKDYRNALVYTPSNPTFQLHLAEALIAAGKYDEARSYLLNLLAESPGSGEINLELARIAAHQKGAAAMQDALRYYYGAIYGVWEGNPLAKRWDVRREFCEYILAHGNVNQAQPEVIALQQDVPPGDLLRQKEAAKLLLRAQLWSRAFDEYRTILDSHKHEEGALAGAGVAAFQMGQYATAMRYFTELPREKQSDPEISAMIETARGVEAANPFLRGLSSEERARRAASALTHAESLARDCSQRPGSTAKSPTVAAALEQLQISFAQESKDWTERNFARDPDLVDAAMNWVFQVENAAAQTCGEPQNAADRALLLLAQSRTPS